VTSTRTVSYTTVSQKCYSMQCTGTTVIFDVFLMRSACCGLWSFHCSKFVSEFCLIDDLDEVALSVVQKN